MQLCRNWLQFYVFRLLLFRLRSTGLFICRKMRNVKWVTEAGVLIGMPPPSPNNWIIDTQRRCGRVGQWVSTQMHKQLAACSHFIFRFWTQSPDEQQFTRLSTAYPRLTPPTESMCAWTQLPWRQCGGWWDGRELSGCWDRRAGECGAKWRRGAVAVAGAASVTGRGRGEAGGGHVSWSCSVVVALLP